VRSPGEVQTSLAWLFEAGHRTGFSGDGLGSPVSFAAWDYCRAANVAGWAFVAYLIDRETAWEVMLRAARLAQSTYGSFQEMGEAYLRGMRVWAGGDDDDRVRTSAEAFAAVLAKPGGPYSLPWTTSLDGVPPPAITQKVEVVEVGGSIAEAVRHVGSGGRVVVGAGHYKESITPPHSVEIVARGDGDVVVEAEGRPAIWAKAEVREGLPRPISVAVRGLTLVAGRSAEGKTLSVPGGFLRLHECIVRATHHGASVREAGTLLLSRTLLDGCGQNGIWSEGGNVAVSGGEIRAPAMHGAYLAKSSWANVFEDTTLRRVGQVGVVAEAEVRIRRCFVEAPGRCGIAVKGPVNVLGSSVKASAGWGVAVEAGGILVLQQSTVEGSTGANVDVKEGVIDARDSAIARGASSGLVLQGQARALLFDTKIEDNAQGNLYAVAGAKLFAARAKVSGDAVGVWLQEATAAFVESDIASAGGQALDVRGTLAPVFAQTRITGGITLDAGTHVCFTPDCTAEGPRALSEGAAVEAIAPPQAQRAIEVTIAAIEGPESPGDDARAN
jgi:hypothetical protein